MKNKYLYKTVCLLLATCLLIPASGCGKKEVEVEEVITNTTQGTSLSAESEEEVNDDDADDKSVLVIGSSDATEETKPEETEKKNAKKKTEEKTSEKKEEKPAVDKETLLSQLVIMQDPRMYTYDQMLSDTEILKQVYPDLFTQDSIGTTADGRMLMHYVVGNPNAEKQIFINGAIHAREYITFQLVMKQMCAYLAAVDANVPYGDVSYRDMWDNVQIHVVPLINPDGVQISQFGIDGIQTESVRDEIYSIASMDGASPSESYFDHWKANAQGVDLNRNFDAYWEYYEGTGQPSSDHYKGTAPGSSPEAAALIDLTMSNNFLYTISYHTQGHVIYWCFENMEPIYDIASSWVNQIIAQTGYSPINDFSTVDPAGYSDWAIYRLQIPSVVIEVASGESPYLADQFQQIWAENQNIWELTAIDAMYR